VSLSRKTVVLVLKTRERDQFDAIVAILKDHGTTFNAEKKSWSVKLTVWDKVLPLLEDIDDLHYETDFRKNLDAIISASSTLKHFDDPISRKSLKIQPIKGKAPFENYQLEDISEGFNTNRYAFYNDPGTGKTYEYMSVCELQRAYRGAGKILFITSNSGVYNMKKEFSKFTNISQDVITVGGVKNRRPFDDLTKEVIVCSYRSILLVHDEYRRTKNGTEGPPKKFLKALDTWLGDKDGILILDECHNVANPSALQTQAIQTMRGHFEYIYIGSGTPADKLEKYYSQLKILDGSLVHNMSNTDWTAKYFNLGTKFSEYEISGIKPEMTPVLQNIVKSVSSRRLAEEVLVIPENNFKKIYTEFSDAHQSIYEQVVTGALQALQERDGAIETRKVQQIFPYLIMAIDDPTALTKHFGDKITNPRLIKDIEKFKFNRDHAKVDLLQDIVSEHPDEKIILWTSHPSVGAHLLDVFAKKNPFIINGTTETPKGYDKESWKLKLVEDFQSDPKRHIAILGNQVMSSSLNIVKCHLQVVTDASYNATEMDQLLKRIHRLGQTKVVTTYIPLIDKSMDVLRRSILEDKEYANIRRPSLG